VPVNRQKDKGKTAKRLVYLLTVLSILVLLVFVAAAGAQQEEETAQDEVVSIQDGYFDSAHIQRVAMTLD